MGTAVRGDSNADGSAVTPAPPALLDHPDIARLARAMSAPQDAVRARLNAVTVDLIVVSLASALLVKSLAGSTSATSRAWVFLVLEFAYFFALEFTRSQTLGKRLFHVRVTTVGGAPPSARQIALRNALRIFDALPFLYASGLISMIRTGPGRRQRIGDVAAATTVVLSDGGRPLPTPRWMLPLLTIVATAISIVIVIAVLNARPTGATSPQAPQRGLWVARAPTLSSFGYEGDKTPAATWRIEGVCPAGASCPLSLVFQGVDEPAYVARLVPEASYWLAIFSPITFRCGDAGGRPAYWRQRSVIALRFTDGGRLAEGLERDVSSSPACGSAAAVRRWSAGLR